MSRRARLAVWDGGRRAVVLSAARGSAYFEHCSAHLRDIDGDSATAYDAISSSVRAAYASSGGSPSIELTDPEDPDRGIALVGSSATGSIDYREADYGEPTVLLMGHERERLPTEHRAEGDALVVAEIELPEVSG